MAEYCATVIALEETAAVVRLDPKPVDCAGATLRCAGCLCWGAPRDMHLPHSMFRTRPFLHERLTLALDEAAVWRSARHWYALQLIALLTGALAGYAMAAAMALPLDLMTLIGAASGTFAAWRISKRRRTHISIGVVGSRVAEYPQNTR